MHTTVEESELPPDVKFNAPPSHDELSAIVGQHLAPRIGYWWVVDGNDSGTMEFARSEDEYFRIAHATLRMSPRGCWYSLIQYSVDVWLRPDGTVNGVYLGFGGICTV